MASPDQLVTVYEAPAPVAELVAGALRANGIDAAVAPGGEAALHPGHGPSLVRVRAEDAEDARQLIEEVEA
jgi:hypothetical protein